MDKMGFDGIDYFRANLQNSFKLKDAFSDNEENEPNLDFRNMLNRELIDAAIHLESTGKISRNEASALMGQALAYHGNINGGPVPPEYDLDSKIRFDFVEQITGMVQFARDHVARGGNDRGIKQLELALEKILALESLGSSQNTSK